MNARDAIIERILPDLKRWRAEQQRVIANTAAPKLVTKELLDETYYFDKFISFFYERRAKEIV